jgi:hypothetical protein
MDDRVAGGLAGRVAESIVGEDHATEIEEPGDEEHEDRQDERELDHGLSPG